jgi:biotin transport system substrate-specific component
VQTLSTHRTFFETLGHSRSGLSRALLAALAVVAGSLLLTASAKTQVPFWPVPMTMQTFVVVALALLYGPRLGLLTIAIYVGQGALGLPVFAGTPERGVGLAYLAGPTGGYVVGFVAATMLVGWLARRGWDRSVPLAIAAAALGMALIYLPGVAWLAGYVGFQKAVAVGAVPFLLADAAKILLAGLLVPTLRRTRRAR